MFACHAPYPPSWTQCCNSVFNNVDKLMINTSEYGSRGGSRPVA